MILYFSTTGNTRFIAHQLAALLNDEALDLLGKIKNGDYSPIRSEKPYVICSPVYVCEMPRFLAGFLRKTPLNGNKDVYFVFTSGGYSGISGVLAHNLMRKKRLRYLGCADVTMPRNYIANNMYPELDAPEIERRIHTAAEGIGSVASAIQNGEQLRSRHVWLFETLITLPFNPVWCRFRQGTSGFHVADRCIGCGKCARICPLNVIGMDDGKPVWNGKHCAHCMSCIQNCPVEAIEYGTITQPKKRYQFEKYRYVVK